MEINGMAHVILTAGDYGKSTAFYRKLLRFLGMAIVFDSDEMLYGVGGRTALGVRAPSPEHEGERFVQSRAGLHHLCFRARERADVDALHEFLLKERAKIVHPPEDGPWAPGYYSVLFEDPDGVRLEMNHVPGKGLLDAGGTLKGL
jgi:catechol 2,3-dioxygenase-like lactoylglutathione lyase family enzyme